MGWDSTYRIVELSRELYKVQPIYVYGDNRLREKYEIKAIEKILSGLEKSDTQATFLPIKFVAKSSIPENRNITKVFDLILIETNLGSQHEWLASLAYIYPGLELGTEASPLEVSNILNAISYIFYLPNTILNTNNNFGKLIKDENSDVYILDPSASSNELLLVLGNFKLPIIK